jgi:hypothetical protein
MLINFEDIRVEIQNRKPPRLWAQVIKYVEASGEVFTVAEFKSDVTSITEVTY